MVKIFWRGFVLTVLVLFSISCSSLKKRAFGFYLKKFHDKQAKNMALSPPPLPYERQDHPVLDAMWWNPRSESSISYFSSCSKIQKTLEEFQKSAFPQNSRYKILKTVLSKDGLYSILEIRQSAQKTYTGVHTVKKGSCWFNINLVAPSRSSFEGEERVFKKFIRDFYSP